MVQWVKNLPAMQETQETWVWILGSGRSSGGGKGNPLQYSCLENPMDKGTLWATVQRVTKSPTWPMTKNSHIYLYESARLNTSELLEEKEMSVEM